MISGYLITGIIFESLKENKFTIADFYVRRINRIIPAYLAMVIASSVAAYFILIPSDLLEYGKSVISSSVFVANIFFWRSSGDYFATASESQPLLHMWSLSVEEQFYVFFPIVMIVLMRFFNARITQVAICIALIISFYISVWAVDNADVAAFFLLPSRAWELLLGSVLAVRMFPSIKSQYVSEAISYLGLTTMLGAIIFLDGDTPFPGYAALLPCMGTFMVLYANQNKLTAVGKLLSHPVCVFFGLISYSLYLWHWPIIVFTKYMIVDELTLPMIIIIAAASVLISFLSYKFVERPFRNGKTTVKSSRVILSGVASLVVLACVGLVFVQSSGFPDRMPNDVRALLASKGKYGEERQNCHNIYSKEIFEYCVLGAKDTSPTFAIVGDSHAGATSAALFEEAARNGRAGYQFSEQGWCPIMGYEKKGEEVKYRDLNDRFTKFLSENPVKEIYLICYWNQSVYDNNYHNAGGEVISGFEAVPSALASMLEKYEDVQFVTMLTPPIDEFFGKDPAAKRILFTSKAYAQISIDEYRHQRADYVNILERVAAGFENLTLKDPIDILCPDGVCRDVTDGIYLYRDDNHLSNDGARKISSLFTPTLSGH